MKKSWIFIIMVLVSLGLNAQTHIPVMQAFDGRYNKVKGVSISIIQQSKDCYYSITVEGNKKIIRQILEMVKKTETMTENKNVEINKDNTRIMMNIPVIVKDSGTIDSKKSNKKDRGDFSTKETEGRASLKKSDVTILVEHKEKKPELTIVIVSQYPISKLTIP